MRGVWNVRDWRCEGECEGTRVKIDRETEEKCQKRDLKVALSGCVVLLAGVIELLYIAVRHFLIGIRTCSCVYHTVCILTTA